MDSVANADGQGAGKPARSAVEGTKDDVGPGRARLAVRECGGLMIVRPPLARPIAKRVASNPVAEGKARRCS